jgi:hypothetical protein
MVYPIRMTNVLEIERAIEKLPPEDYGRLRDWIENYDLERDAGAASACIAEMLDEEDGGEDQLTAE